MITAFNAILECAVTGLFCALFLYLLARFGILPLYIHVTMNAEEYKQYTKSQGDVDDDSDS